MAPAPPCETVTVAPLELEPLWLPSPRYSDVNVCVPAGSAAVVKCATPLERLAVPRTVAPSLKRTCPVGEEPDTVAVSAAVCPNAPFVGFAESDVVESRLAIVSDVEALLAW